jgi:hypothetical protein
MTMTLLCTRASGLIPLSNCSFASFDQTLPIPPHPLVSIILLGTSMESALQILYTSKKKQYLSFWTLLISRNLMSYKLIYVCYRL